MSQGREILRAGPDCTAFVSVQPDGRANVHILRRGRRPLSILGADVTKRQADKTERAV